MNTGDKKPNGILAVEHLDGKPRKVVFLRDENRMWKEIVLPEDYLKEERYEMNMDPFVNFLTYIPDTQCFHFIRWDLASDGGYNWAAVDTYRVVMDEGKKCYLSDLHKKDKLYDYFNGELDTFEPDVWLAQVRRNGWHRLEERDLMVRISLTNPAVW